MSGRGSAAAKVGAKSSKKLGNVKMTPVKRAAEYPDNYFRGSGNSMFCDACNVTVDWQRKSSVDYHALKCTKHLNNLQQIANGKRPVPTQTQTLEESVASKDIKDEFIKDFITTIMAAGLSVEIVDDLKPFLVKYCPLAGALPGPSGLRKTWLNPVFLEHEAELQALVKDKIVTVVFDEMNDLMDRAVLNILLCKYFYFETFGGMNH